MTFISNYRIVMALILFCGVSGCGKRGDPEPIHDEVQEVNVETSNTPSIQISPEKMLSRPSATDKRSEPSAIEAEDKYVTASPKRKSATASRIVYRYIQPAGMISDERIDEAPEKDAKARQEIGVIENVSVASRLSEMAAIAYVNRSRMISGSEHLSGQTISQAEARASSPGFIDDVDPLIQYKLYNESPANISDNPYAAQKAMSFIREAETRLNEGNYEDAELHFSKALLLFPNSIYINRQLGHIELNIGKYNQAVGHYTAALDSNEKISESLNELGIAHLYAGRNKEALENFEAAIKANGDLIEPIYNAGVALRQLNRIDDAKEKMNMFLLLEPDNARGYRELAMLSLIQTNRLEAIEMLNNAMRLDSSWGMPCLDLAVVFAESEEYLKALEMLERALSRTSALRVHRVYSMAALKELHLMFESRPFEARLSDELRKLF